MSPRYRAGAKGGGEMAKFALGADSPLETAERRMFVRGERLKRASSSGYGRKQGSMPLAAGVQAFLKADKKPLGLTGTFSDTK
jgi:hypothetical protein